MNQKNFAPKRDHTMKTYITNPFTCLGIALRNWPLPMLIAGLSLILGGRATAQILINSDGANPNAGLILSGSTLYGTVAAGGSYGHGTVFAVDTNGASFRILHSFTGGSDGANPWSGLIRSGNTLFGTAYNGGIYGHGTVFKVHTDGSGFTTLHSFTYGSDGAGPIGGLILTNNTLYGTADLGGISGAGTVFSLSLPSPPLLLTILPSGTNVMLSWPANVDGFDYTGFNLQSTTNLGSPSVWSTNSLVPVIINGQNRVTNSISATQQFYRLSQ
jgi:uncharacterized repeat protein (TIGR03803 family)